MFIAALFATAEIRKQTMCPPTDECIKKMWYTYIYINTHTMEYYSANEILPFVTT